VGKPSLIYKKPENPFVAGFIGISNFLDCEIGGENPESAEIRLNGFNTNLRTHLKRPYQGKGRLSLRPEQLTFASGEEDGLPGRIELSTFLGDFIEYEVLLKNGQTVQLNEYTKDSLSIKPDGTEVYISFDPLSVSVFSADQEVLSC
jgi:iron(III) transport system ATP-binding protein